MILPIDPPHNRDCHKKQPEGRKENLDWTSPQTNVSVKATLKILASTLLMRSVLPIDSATGLLRRTTK